MVNNHTLNWDKFNAEFNAKLDAKFLPKIELLEREAKLIPIKQDTLAHIESFISWFDLSNEWFLKSRNLKVSDEERKLNLVIYEFYKARSDLILEKLSDFLPKELQSG